jgi:SIR2-like domain
MVQTPENAIYRLHAKRLLAGAVVPFLGAGVNLCERPDSAHFEQGKYLPSGAELATYLAERMDYPYEDTTNLLRVSQWWDVIVGDNFLRSELHTVFDADYPPTLVHRLLAALPRLLRAQPSRPTFFPLIVTTNYDDALERAFAAEDEPYDKITYLAVGPDRGRFLHSRPDGTSQVIAVSNTYNDLHFDERPVIAKIHGAVVRGAQDGDRDSYVITENDYIEYLGRTDIAKLLPIGIATRMRRSHLLFLGYSLKDWNLRVILNRLWGDDVGTRSWAVQPDPDPIEERSWRDRKVDLIDMRLGTYITGLQAALLEAASAMPTAS